MYINDYGFVIIDDDKEGQLELVRKAMRKLLGPKGYLVDFAVNAKWWDFLDAMYCDQANWRTVDNPEICAIYRGHRFYIEALGMAVGKFFWLVRNGDVAHLLKYPRFVAKLPTEIQEMVELGFVPKTITYEDGTTVRYHDDPTEPID